MGAPRKAAHNQSRTEDAVELSRKQARRRLTLAVALTISALSFLEIMGFLSPTDYSKEIEKMDWVVIRQATTPDGRTCYEEDKITQSRITHTLKCITPPAESTLSSFFKQKS